MNIKYIIALMIFCTMLFSSCGTESTQEQEQKQEQKSEPKFCVGQIVKIKVDGRKAIIVHVYKKQKPSDIYRYGVRFAASSSMKKTYDWLSMLEFELEPLNDR